MDCECKQIGFIEHNYIMTLKSWDNLTNCVFYGESVSFVEPISRTLEMNEFQITELCQNIKWLNWKSYGLQTIEMMIRLCIKCEFEITLQEKKIMKPENEHN